MYMYMYIYIYYFSNVNANYLIIFFLQFYILVCNYNSYYNYKYIIF